MEQTSTECSYGEVILPVVSSINFGSRIAEHEKDLKSYFVQTETWRQVRDGEADLVVAPKGCGKSALYSMLLSIQDELFDRRILIAPGEEMSGTPAFESLASGDKLSEAEFIKIWKLYFLVLIYGEIEQYGIKNPASERLHDALRDADLLPGSAPRAGILATIRDYFARIFNPVAIEPGISLDPTTQTITGGSARIEFSQLTNAQERAGRVGIFQLYKWAEEALAEDDYTVWIVLDRLDAAFAPYPQQERNALRGLIRAYSDLYGYERVRIKMFLRSDIWTSITDVRFVEASHVEESEISWDADSLLRMIVRRLCKSPELLAHYHVTEDEVLSSSAAQERFFYRVFPDQVDSGSGRSRTWNWSLARTRDSSGVSAPRELIHLFSEVRAQQLKRFESALTDPSPSTLFHRSTFGDAMPKVSEARLLKTIYAEFTDAKPYIEKLKGKKAGQPLNALAATWGTSSKQARTIADRLMQIGFMSARSDKIFEVPFIYRYALEMPQGTADDPGEQFATQ